MEGGRGKRWREGGKEGEGMEGGMERGREGEGMEGGGEGREGGSRTIVIFLFYTYTYMYMYMYEACAMEPFTEQHTHPTDQNTLCPKSVRIRQITTVHACTYVGQ